ncbi:cation diffusion facilitator family transporter [Spizellomyces punctatus DAOM BR117]|uniref:Cation diffusion facilitator family transporter n=1 Tax=Spizellomyces punctatus (strain DAOM BR117) TaxID=645134 RepID=A0A0L0H9U1_SPIPD|nr:cation diffusion facilitator family transporter [Spizellomyces punctatus DAOM BR117]KNC97423.1 cation diffusion facilitator family transporter [Spizellomyces punctatus DAOM BR117]|eukprot:XP_016605463.1 cation diffusion facilitator family transporter [Spizellomyces punctatus DAOM BR117]
MSFPETHILTSISSVARPHGACPVGLDINFHEELNLATHSPSPISPIHTTDVEQDLFTRRNSESEVNDPLLLQQHKKQAEELNELRKRGKAGKQLTAFYERQNELIDDLLRPPDTREEGEAKNLVKLKVAVYGSLLANICLFALQLVAAILSGSLALFATTADAFMDLASSAVLVYTGRAALSQNFHQYPTGKTRMETAGIIVFASLMATLSVQLMVEGARALISSSHEVDLSPLSIGLIAAAIATKGVLYLYCQAVSQYPSARILAQDHRNDIFMNSIGITLSVLGQKVACNRLTSGIYYKGAILIAALILRSWAGTAHEHIQYIVGKTAEPAFLQRVTYLTLTHDPRILQIDTCRAYHAGNNFFVEVDIVLPPNMLLAEAHDIGEALQIKLETLPNVERAFVHLDYETTHAPEHRKMR